MKQGTPEHRAHMSELIQRQRGTRERNIHIGELYINGIMTLPKIAKKYGISRSRAWQIVRKNYQ